MSSGNFKLSVFTLLHFCVDLTCIYFLMSTVAVSVADHHSWLVMAVLYNFMAFAFPALLGYVIDILDRCEAPASLGCLLIMIAVLIHSNILLSVIFIGLGNGLFHVGAGRRVLLQSKRKYAPGGIFISAGAIGVFLGNYWGSCHYVLYGFFAVIMAAGAVILFVMNGSDVLNDFSDESKGIENEKNISGRNVGIILIVWFVMLFSVVGIRSYYGYQTAYAWKNGFTIGLIFTLCIAAGKFMGGIAADKMGIKVTIIVSLLLAGILAVFSFDVPACGMISILFFNMTMPLTLSLMHESFENRPGFAFGVLMLALFLGTLPTMIWKNMAFSSPFGLAFLCGLSLIIMLAVIYLMKKSGKRT